MKNKDEINRQEVETAINEILNDPELKIPNLEQMLERPGERELWESQEVTLFTDISENPYDGEVDINDSSLESVIKNIPASEVPMWLWYTAGPMGGGGDERAVLLLPPEKFRGCISSGNDSLEKNIIDDNFGDSGYFNAILKDGTIVNKYDLEEIAKKDPEEFTTGNEESYRKEVLSDKYFGGDVQFLVYISESEGTDLFAYLDWYKSESTKVVGKVEIDNEQDE